MQEEKYILYDLFDGCWEIVDTFDSIDAATDAAREYDEECDGECVLILTSDNGTSKAPAPQGVIIDDWRY